MNQTEYTIKVLFSLIQSEICEKEPNEKYLDDLSNETMEQLYKITKSHDIAHLLASALNKQKLLAQDETSQKYQKQLMIAVYRYEKINYELERVSDIFENHGIEFLPLKGSVLRKFYPEPWMRTSCDIDILVHEEDLEKAKDVLINDGKYVFHKKDSHDISLFSQNNIHIELHYTLVEQEFANRAAIVLENVWKSSTIKTGYSFWHVMCDEMFYFYHIAHMAKHFEYGGCGIRPFIDLWILNHRVIFDKEKRKQLLVEGELLTFATQAELLSEVWFGIDEHTEVTRQMQEYILGGGVYGTNENRIAVQQQKRGGKLKYLLSKIFLPYEKIKFHYPILEKHKWLMPLMEVRRWCKLVFCGHLKRVAKEIHHNYSITNNEATNTQDLLKNIGL